MSKLNLKNSLVIKQNLNISSLQKSITRRELAVLWCVMQGMKNKSIADYLCIATSTVKFHLANLYSKTSTSNRTELTKKIFLMILNSSLSFEEFLKIFSESG